MLLRWFSGTARTENHSSWTSTLPSVLTLFLTHRSKFPTLCWASQLEYRPTLHFLGGQNQTHAPISNNLFLYVYMFTALPFSQTGDLVVIFKNFFCFCPYLPCPGNFIADQFQIYSPYHYPMAHFRTLLQWLLTWPFSAFGLFLLYFIHHMLVERSFWNTDLVVFIQ